MGEEFLDLGGAVDAKDYEDGADGLGEAVLFGVGPGGDVPKPHVEGGPFEADVGTGAKVEAGDEDSDPEFALGGTQGLW